MNHHFIPCMNFYFSFTTTPPPPQNREKISAKISYAAWFLVALQGLPLGL